jgi:hypothetical protein
MLGSKTRGSCIDGLLKGFPLEKILSFFQNIFKKDKYVYYGDTKK